MLVLTRKPGQRIVINAHGESIVVSLVSTRNGQARIGIEAPRDIGIAREELAPLENKYACPVPIASPAVR